MTTPADLLRKYATILNEAPVNQPPVVPQQQPPVQAAANTQVNTKVATGAQTLSKAVGVKGGGQMLAKGLGKIAQGQSVTGQQSQAIAPFIEPLQKILADPALKQKFLNLINQVR